MQMMRFAAAGLLGSLLLAGCKKQEQAVVSVAHNAEEAARQAELRAQAANIERDREKTELAKIPLPTKSLYSNVHEAGEWKNPFISVDADYLDLRVTMTDANPSQLGEGTMLRPEAARRQEVQIRPDKLADALIALPTGAWRYGRVVAVAESPNADRKKRAQVRRNVEAAIQKLNDLGVVVVEWPAR